MEQGVILRFQCEWCLTLHKGADAAGRCERECQAKVDAYQNERAAKCNGECLNSICDPCRKHDPEMAQG